MPPYHVILLNDDDHTYEYVIEMLKVLFAFPDEKGFQLAREVDREGRVILMTTHRERAELKRDQIHAYGVDHRVATCKGSMSATIELAGVTVPTLPSHEQVDDCRRCRGFGGGGVEADWRRCRFGRLGRLLQFFIRGLLEIAIEQRIGVGFVRTNVGDRGTFRGLPGC